MPDAIEPADAGRVVTRRAEHARQNYDGIVLTCRAAVGDTEPLVYLAHYTRGVFDFAVSAAGRGAPQPEDHDRLDRSGRQLNLAVARLEKVCGTLDSGALIRVVLQGEHAALFHYLKVDGQSIFGWARGESVEPIRAADLRIFDVVETAVGGLGLQSINWGGFRTRAAQASAELAAGARGAADAPPVEPAAKPHLVSRIRERADEEIARRASDALSVKALHYLGLFREGEPVFCVDILDAADLAQFFQKTSPEGRRDGYAAVARQLRLQENRLEQVLGTVDGGRVMRLVLDVALGAIYVTPLRDGGILLGVTLEQRLVDDADAAFGRLSGRVGGRWPQC
ncbi:hypothetical protein KGA66_00660 [Actinocrinis puniceicyclus]|uniref:Uncharacterized protein n=1 Tax=Actinocrinis puniceicyclus TaxID=977794 RepID=A0A8J8BAX8_9ACTN|nr:hypothetical protein [Actinocrinis puniceicyclus]MBS2961536.1 hypothetical protein [Actinocrinis puniceicyclus]